MINVLCSRHRSDHYIIVVTHFNTNIEIFYLKCFRTIISAQVISIDVHKFIIFIIFVVYNISWPCSHLNWEILEKLMMIWRYIRQKVHHVLLFICRDPSLHPVIGAPECSSCILIFCNIYFHERHIFIQSFYEKYFEWGFFHHSQPS